MDDRQQRTTAMFQRVVGFLEDHPIEPEPPLIGRMRTQLARSIASLQKLQQDQAAALTGITGRDVQHLRTHMRREVMMPLVRIAKPLLQFAPGVDGALRVPHARTDLATLAASALALVAALKPHARLLASAGYSRDYLAQVTRDARRLAAVNADAASARQRRAHATAAIRQEIARGMRAVTVIEGILLAHHGTRPEEPQMYLWHRARRIPARMGRPRTRRRQAAPLAADAAPSS